NALLVLILRSAHAQALPQSRTRVRASRRMRTATGWLRDAWQRSYAVAAFVHPFALRCSSASGRGRAAHFGKPSGSAGAKNQPAAVGNDRQLGFPVSGLFFTGSGATPTCRAVSVRSARSPVSGQHMGREFARWNAVREPAGIPQQQVYWTATVSGRRFSQLSYSQRDAGSGWRPQQIDPCIYKPPRLGL